MPANLGRDEEQANDYLQQAAIHFKHLFCSDSRRKLGDQVREDYYPESLSPLFVSKCSVK